MNNIERFDGLAKQYNKYAVRVPSDITEMILTHTGIIPSHIIDIGCGPGSSTEVWADKATRVIGVEPNEDMLSVATSTNKKLNVDYVKGTSDKVNVVDGIADIVVISQALHLMQPMPTFNEVKRILKPGGTFVVIDYSWPPIITKDVETLLKTYETNVAKLVRSKELHGDERFHKSEHLERMKLSNCFSAVNEFSAHSKQIVDTKQLIGILKTSSGYNVLRKSKITDKDIGIESLSNELQILLGDKKFPVFFQYKVRVGVK